MNRFLVFWSDKDLRWAATSLVTGRSYAVDSWNTRVEARLLEEDAPDTLREPGEASPDTEPAPTTRSAPA